MSIWAASQPALYAMATTINSGQFTMLPVPGMDASPGAIAAQLLAREAQFRLSNASIYYATGDMTALALAAAASPRAEPVKESQLPLRTG